MSNSIRKNKEYNRKEDHYSRKDAYDSKQSQRYKDNQNYNIKYDQNYKKHNTKDYDKRGGDDVFEFDDRNYKTEKQKYPFNRYQEGTGGSALHKLKTPSSNSQSNSYKKIQRQNTEKQNKMPTREESPTQSLNRGEYFPSEAR